MGQFFSLKIKEKVTPKSECNFTCSPNYITGIYATKLRIDARKQNKLDQHLRIYYMLNTKPQLPF